MSEENTSDSGSGVVRVKGKLMLDDMDTFLPVMRQSSGYANFEGSECLPSLSA